MENQKIIIYTSSYIINKGISAHFKEMNLDVELRRVESELELEKALKNQQFDFFITNGKTLNSLNTLNNEIEKLKIILFGKEDCSFSTNLKIIKRLSLNQSKEEIFNTFSDIFKEKTVETETAEISEREQEIIKLVAKGLTNKDIAEKLFLSIHTVITHRKNITKKLGIKTISGLTIYAVLNGLIDLEASV